MTVEEISISDLYGTKHAHFRVGTWTEIKGANAAGKSSLLKAIALLFDGGSEPGAVRKGCAKGKITLRLEGGVTITKTQRQDGQTTEVKDADGIPIRSPQAYINALADSCAINPAKLLACSEKELVSVLSRLLPLDFSPDEIQQATDGAISPKETLNLDGLEKTRAELYEQRRRANLIVRDSEGTIATLNKSLPTDDKTNWKAEEKRLAAEVGKARETLRVRQNAHHSEIESQRNALRQQAQADIERIKDALALALQALAEQERTEIETLASESQPAIERLISECAAAGQKAQQQDRPKGAREHMDALSKTIGENDRLSDKLSRAIDALDSLKKQKLDALPIPGLEVHGDKVLLDGVEFKHVNAARRVDVVLQLAALYPVKARFMILDNAEMLDAETYEALKSAVTELGYQFVVARVGEGPLKIEVDEPERSESKQGSLVA